MAGVETIWSTPAIFIVRWFSKKRTIEKNSIKPEQISFRFVFKFNYFFIYFLLLNPWAAQLLQTNDEYDFLQKEPELEPEPNLGRKLAIGSATLYTLRMITDERQHTFFKTFINDDHHTELFKNKKTKANDSIATTTGDFLAFKDISQLILSVVLTPRSVELKISA